MDPIDVGDYSNLEVHLAVNARAVNNYDSAALSNGDYLRVLVDLDSTGETMIGQFTKMAPQGSNGRLGLDTNLDGLGNIEIQDYTTLEDYIFEVPTTVGNHGSGNLLVVKVRTRFDANNEEIVYDNVRVYGTPVSTTQVGDWMIIY
jgi:hypothetical protein